jgi:hypothetical protein
LFNSLFYGIIVDVSISNIATHYVSVGIVASCGAGIVINIIIVISILRGRVTTVYICVGIGTSTGILIYIGISTSAVYSTGVYIVICIIAGTVYSACRCAIIIRIYQTG